MGDSKLSDQPIPSHLPKYLPLIPSQLQTSISITQNTKTVKIHKFSSNLHYSRCLTFLHSCCFQAQQTRLLQLVYVIESITLFTSVDYRNHPKFSFSTEVLRTSRIYWINDILKWGMTSKSLQTALHFLFIIESSGLWVKGANQEVFLTGTQRSKHFYPFRAQIDTLFPVPSIQNSVSYWLKEDNVMFCHVKSVLRKTIVYGGQE